MTHTLDAYPKLPDELKDKYDFACSECGEELYFKPSLLMNMGVNSGCGSCSKCQTFLHLWIDGEDGKSEPHSELMKKYARENKMNTDKKINAPYCCTAVCLHLASHSIHGTTYEDESHTCFEHLQQSLDLKPGLTSSHIEHQITLVMDGNAWSANFTEGFENMQENPCGFGETPDLDIKGLIQSFEDAVQAKFQTETLTPEPSII